MPVTRDHKKDSLLFFVKLWEIRDQSRLPMPSFKIEAQVFTILAVIYVVDIVLGKIEPESPIELGHTTHYPKNVQGTLIKTYFKISQKIG